MAVVASVVVPELTPDVGGDQVAIAGGELVRLRNGATVSIEGVPSVAALGPRKSAASLSGSAYAFLNADAGALYMTAPGSEAREIVKGSSLTRPSFDPENWMWTSRDVGGRSEILAVPPGGSEAEAAVLATGWLGYRRVEELRVSRDGSRVLIVADRGGTSELLLAGIRRSTEGTPQALTTPLALPVDATVDTAAWAGQSTIVVSALDREVEAVDEGP